MFDESPPQNFEEWVDWLIGLIGRYPDNIMIGEIGYVPMIQHILRAREKVPSSGADWEIAAFFGPAVAATVALLAYGRVESYAQFRQLASAVFGWEVRPLIPALFAAGTMHPSLNRQWAERLATSMTLHDLRIIEA